MELFEQKRRRHSGRSASGRGADPGARELERVVRTAGGLRLRDEQEATDLEGEAGRALEA